MNTSDLITEVRNGLVEYQQLIISDAVILSNLNHPYRQVYNHYAKASDNMFGQVVELNLVPNQRVYELPRALWSKRVDYMQAPTPGESARGYVKIDKVDAKMSHRYNILTATSPVPWAWQQLGNEIEIFPQIQRALTVRLITQPSLVPLAKTEGVVFSFASPTLNCVAALSSEFAARATSAVGENYLSISDPMTGVVKHVVRYTAVTAAAITLANPSNRTSVRGKELSTLAQLTNVALDDLICYQYGTGASILGEAFNEYIIKYAILAIKSSLNESDVSIKDQIKELKAEYLSDRCGRPGTSEIERIPRGNFSLNSFRRSR